MRDALIFHIASGESFFSGAVFILAAVFLAACTQRSWIKLVRTIMAWLGLLLVAASATPLPGPFYAAGITVTLVWLVLDRRQPARFARVVVPLGGAVIAIWCAGILLEARYHRIPDVPAMGDGPVYVVGDSLAAGMGTEAATWPRLLGRHHSVRDVSLAGATASTAVRDQARA